MQDWIEGPWSVDVLHTYTDLWWKPCIVVIHIGNVACAGCCCRCLAARWTCMCVRALGRGHSAACVMVCCALQMGIIGWHFTLWYERHASLIVLCQLDLCVKSLHYVVIFCDDFCEREPCLINIIMHLSFDGWLRLCHGVCKGLRHQSWTKQPPVLVNYYSLSTGCGMWHVGNSMWWWCCLCIVVLHVFLVYIHVALCFFMWLVRSGGQRHELFFFLCGQPSNLIRQLGWWQLLCNWLVSTLIDRFSFATWLVDMTCTQSWRVIVFHHSQQCKCMTVLACFVVHQCMHLHRLRMHCMTMCTYCMTMDSMINVRQCISISLSNNHCATMHTYCMAIHYSVNVSQCVILYCVTMHARCITIRTSHCMLYGLLSVWLIVNVVVCHIVIHHNTRKS